MAARFVWGTTGDDSVLVDPDAVARTEESDFTFLDRGESGETPVGPATEGEGAIPAERVIFLVDDEGETQPIAVASEHVVGNADVLTAVEAEWKARTGG